MKLSMIHFTYVDRSVPAQSLAAKIYIMNLLFGNYIKIKCIQKGSNTHLYRQRTLSPPKPN